MLNRTGEHDVESVKYPALRLERTPVLGRPESFVYSVFPHQKPWPRRQPRPRFLSHT